MGTWIQTLDRILRGEGTRPADLRQGRIELPAGGLCVIIVVLGAAYGFCMGWFALFDRDKPQYWQVVASMLKVPALFFLTLLVTFPSLYVFNALVGSRLTAASLLRLLIAALAVMLAVLASFGPIVAFFSLTTSNYPFMILLNVVLFGVAGLLGLAFLLQTLHRLTAALMTTVPPQAEWPAQAPAGESAAVPVPPPLSTGARSPGALERLEGQVFSRNVKSVFNCWVIIFALVGAQMSWVLRPFIGNPAEPFTWFRPRASNFFESVVGALRNLFS